MFIACLLSLATFGQAPKEVTAVGFLNNTLTNGTHKFTILEKDIPADLRKIALRYRQAVSDSMQWFHEYSQLYADQSPLPYHKNFGISEAEYDRMNNEFPRLKMKTKDVKTLEVNKTDGYIGFKGDGVFTIFDAVVIDVNNDKMLIDEQAVPYSGEVSEDESSGFGAWKGYKWRAESGSMDDVKAFKDTDYSLIEISVGKTLQSNKTVIVYKTIYVEGGEPRINGSVTGYLD